MMLNDPHYVKRVSLMFEVRDTDFIFNMGSTELSYIDRVHREKLKEIEESSGKKENKEVYKVSKED